MPRLDLSKTSFAQAAVYFPIVGSLIGLLGGGLFWIAHLFFSQQISVVLVLSGLMLATGALHEDGLADAFDAFGSKTTKKDILEVMRDSRIGTYGTLALIMIVLLKYLGLQSMTPQSVVIALVVGHTLSRWAMLPALALLPYPRKSAALTKRFVESVDAMPKWHLAVSLVFSGGLAWWLLGATGLYLLVISTVTGLLFAWYFWKKIQGATGDCYGTIQQCTEVLIYLCILKLV
jgi:adenosylcobinamide-GDP ribazoletransferase